MGLAGFIYDKLKAKGRDTRTRPPEGMNCMVDGRRYDAQGNLNPEGWYGYPEYPFVTDIAGGSCTLKYIGKPSAAEVERQKAFMGIVDEEPTKETIYTIMDTSGTLPFFDFPAPKVTKPMRMLEPITPPTEELTPMEHIEAAVRSEDVGSALGHVAGAVASVDPVTALGLTGAALVGAVLLLKGK